MREAGAGEREPIRAMRPLRLEAPFPPCKDHDASDFKSRSALAVAFLAATLKVKAYRFPLAAPLEPPNSPRASSQSKERFLRSA